MASRGPLAVLCLGLVAAGVAVRGIGLSDLVTVGRRWASAMPRRPFLIGGLIFVVLGQILQALGGLRALQAFAEGALDQLGRFAPFSLAASYYRRLEGCYDQYDIYGNFVGTECRGVATANLDRVVGALWRTLQELLASPNEVGASLFLVALVVGFGLGWRLLMWLGGEGGPFHILFVAILTPFIASLVALVMQWVGIAFFTVFGAVIGFLIWVGSVLAFLFSLIRLGREVHGSAQSMQDASDTIRKMTGRPPPPP
jgi:hypothetical protein